MNENREKRLPAGLIWLLVFQWLLVLISLSYAVVFAVFSITERKYSYADIILPILYILVLAPWGASMAYASVQMARRRPRGFLVGMICHLLLLIVSMCWLFCLGSTGILMSLANNDTTRAWAPLALLFALVWLPFALISGWGFFYLRRLRKDLLA